MRPPHRAALLRAVPSVSLLVFLTVIPASRAETNWHLGHEGRALQKGSDGRPLSVAVHSYSPAELDRVLAAAPRVDTGFVGAIRFPLPTPSGELVDFLVVERPTLAPELQSEHPDLRTYAGLRKDDSRTELRLTRSSEVLIASVLGPEGWSLDSTLSAADDAFHIWNNADDPSSGPSQCLMDFDQAYPYSGRKVDTATHGTDLRTYEFAMTGTGEFAVFHGSVATAQAQIAALVNLANGVLERELAVRFQLVDINVYPDPATDPFSDGLTPNVVSIDENQDALDSKLGFNNYELGHVVSRLGAAGWRGLAQPGTQCDRFGKARGATYAASPTSSSLLEGILHECGHQLGALHSFNGTAGSCGANREPLWAYEIASGVTLMSYAGICGSENVISPRLPMYNGGALESIVAQMASTSNCGSLVSTGNNLPVADAGPDYTIPRETAFVLDGSGTVDADPDNLTYSWEQHDLGPASPPYGPAAGPLFRNFAATSSALRSMPTYSIYRNGQQAPYEFLPTVDRSLTFRLVVRDNRSGGGGIGWDTTVLTVAGSPFRVLSPNGGESFAAGSDVPVTWQVGGGGVAPDVRILFSADSGNTWNEVESSTSNDGAHTIALPCATTTAARLRIEPTDNIFFDISNGDFTVTPDATPPTIVCPPPFSVPATSSAGIDKDDPALADWFASAEAFDGCDPDPTISVPSAPTFPIGTTIVPFLATDDAGNFNVCTVELTVTEPTSAPSVAAATALLGIHPNPFNPATAIVFRLATAQQVHLAVYDLRGRRVATVHEGALAAGRHELRWDAGEAPSGVYVARLQTRDGTFERRLALLK